MAGDLRPAAPAVAEAVAGNRRLSRRLAKAAAGLLLVLLGLVTLLVIGADVGAIALVTGLALAAVPVPVYVLLALRIDRFEPEPLPMLAWAFLWGATAATFIALVLNTAGQAIIGSSFGSDVGELYGNSISAPIVEESAKGAALFAVYRLRRAEFNGVLDGLIYAAMVGLGFAMTENVLYYGHAAVEGGIPLAATFFLRGVLSPFTHPVFTAMTGIGLGVAVYATRGWVRALAPPLGFAAAILLHSLWNTSSTVGGGGAFVLVYFTIMVPVFAALLVVIALAVQREGRIVREQLRPEVASGLLSGDDLLVVSSLRERRRALRQARHARGRAGRRAREAFHLAATELAFHRFRLARGLRLGRGAAADDESVYLETLRRLRGEVAPSRPAPSTVAAATAAAQPTAHAAGVPASWYPDPWRQARWRWWDGRAWTYHTAD